MATRKEEINIPAGQELNSIQVTINFNRDVLEPPLVGVIMRQMIDRIVYYSIIPPSRCQGCQPQRGVIKEDDSKLWDEFINRNDPKNGIAANSSVIIYQMRKDVTGLVSFLPNDLSIPPVSKLLSSEYDAAGTPPASKLLSSEYESVGLWAFWNCVAARAQNNANGLPTIEDIQACAG